MHIIDVRNVTKRYHGHTALENVTISVNEGSVFGLLGPNGAGKTSLIRIINQITGPDEGQVLFKGETLQPKHTAMIGYLPEERGLYKKMEVGEQALYLARLKGLSRKDALAKLKYWFERFEIQDWWKKKVEELSKGMAQKVQFIVTVLHEPPLLILDEPFSGFDPINANLIKNEILELQKKGSTIIFSTHNMSSVEEMCDHIALINKSKVVLDGNVNDIRKQFRSMTYEVELSDTNSIKLSNALWTNFELGEIKNVDSNTIRAKIKLLNNNTSNDLIKVLLDVGHIDSFRELIPSMNDIFISAVVGSGEEMPILTE
ncbi:MAG: ATP-binding cassette domain-containing protein [Bacteroidia bacterium]|nr:ATP-binding cassette domain-containing protein [Bacteroidia bacterium]